MSGTTISRWIRKFGIQQKTERVIGQKQILIDFKDKMIELAEQTYSVDIKKNFSTQPLKDTGKKGKNTPSA